MHGLSRKQTQTLFNSLIQIDEKQTRYFNNYVLNIKLIAQ